MTKMYLIKITEAIHETETGMARSGMIDKTTMHRIDLSRLTAVEPLSADEIQALREAKR